MGSAIPLLPEFGQSPWYDNLTRALATGGLQKLIEVDRDPVLGRLCHQMTVSSSARMATPRSRIWPKAAKISPTASQPSGVW